MTTVSRVEVHDAVGAQSTEEMVKPRVILAAHPQLDIWMSVSPLTLKFPRRFLDCGCWQSSWKTKVMIMFFK